MTTSQLHFNVLLILFGIRRIDLGIFGLHELIEIVTRPWLRARKRSAHILIEFSSESITVVDSEYSVKETNIGWEIEIPPCVVISEFSNHFGYFLSFQEHSLGNTAVLNFGFGDEDSLVGQVVVNFDFPNAVVL